MLKKQQKVIFFVFLFGHVEKNAYLCIVKQKQSINKSNKQLLWEKGFM